MSTHTFWTYYKMKIMTYIYGKNYILKEKERLVLRVFQKYFDTVMCYRKIVNFCSNYVSGRDLPTCYSHAKPLARAIVKTLFQVLKFNV